MNTENKLRLETSPYLLQHKSNPVHWHPWNNETLTLAKQLNKPILLSIGYSACHWCHVMAHESFENQKTAEIMNEFFTNIKVDKEEHPDLDTIYQNAHSLLTERPGGWPLTVFLTPNTHMPIFAGTYFPAEAKHGLPAFASLLQQIHDIWQTRQSDIEQQSQALQSSYTRLHESSKPTCTALDNTPSDIARNQIEKQFDAVNGGFSSAPKFPHPAILSFAFKHWEQTCQLNQPDKHILHCGMHSLETMANGGIFDHLGGGFCRYSTDNQWMIPHFEKMLYDNGPLLALYSQAWKLNNNTLLYDAACETANWVMREMQPIKGGYYAAQDADSEGHEGKFFAWSKKEIEQHLNNACKQTNIDQHSTELFKQRFGLNRDENFEGSWHLHGYCSEESLAKDNAIDETQLHQQLHQLRQYLFQQREKRVHPDTDTKILTAWNGLMIHGMSVAGRLLDKPTYIESAMSAAFYLKNHCWLDKKLHATCNDGKAKLNAYLDDFAFLIYGLLELLQSQWNNELYIWSLELADDLIRRFEDEQYGGFYFTSHDHEDLIQRLKIFSDDAIPSGNAIAALALNRLGYLSGQPQYIASAERCLKSAWTSINDAPISHCALLNALNEYLSPPNILIMRTVGVDKEIWRLITQQYHLTNTLIYNIPADQTPHSSLNAKAAENRSQAYPCHGTQCLKPLKSSQELHFYLRNNSYRVLE